MIIQQENRTSPRDDRLNWNDHHMAIALVTSQRSPDPNTQVGACIVDKKNRILGTGYNGPPRGLGQSTMPWDREGKPEYTKYAYVVHAERNAIFNCNYNIEGATLYVTMFPCNECAKDILQTGIERVIYLTNPYKDTWQNQAAEWMLSSRDITVIQHTWETKSVQCLQKTISMITKIK